MFASKALPSTVVLIAEAPMTFPVGLETQILRLYHVEFTDLDDLNAQAEQWCRTQAADRPCPEDRAMTVREAFAQEQSLLLPLPANPFPVEEQVAVKVGKTP
jgi:hypothetical protein